VQGILRSAGRTGIGRSDVDFIFAVVRSGVHSARSSGGAEGPRIEPAGTVTRRIFDRLRRPSGRELVQPPSLSIDECVTRGRAHWHVARAPALAEPAVARALGSRTVPLRTPSRWPEFGVLELERGHVVGAHGWVMTDGGAVIPELSWYGGPSERIRVPRGLEVTTEVRGSCLSLVSDWSCRNFAHFLLDGLGRLAVFIDAGFTLNNVDHVYCPTPPSTPAAQLLGRFGIPAEKRIFAGQNIIVRADVLYAPGLPAAELAYPPWLAHFLRRAVGLAGGDLPNRRLYVSRRGYGRHALTEEDVEALVAAHGFEIYDATDARSRPEDFDLAETVVGAHGAGLANVVFCRPGTNVLEIVPTDNAYPFYFSLAHAAGLEYSCLFAPSVGQRHPDAFGPSPYDFEVELDELAAVLPAPREPLA